MSDLSISLLDLFTSFLESHGKRRVHFAVLLDQCNREIYIQWSESPPVDGHHEDRDTDLELVSGPETQELQSGSDMQEVQPGSEMQDFTCTSSSPAEGQWRLRIQTCEDGLFRASKSIEELLKQTENQQKELVELHFQGDKIMELIDQLKQTGSQEEVVQLELHQDEKHSADLSQFVTFDDLQSALLHERENIKLTHLPPTPEPSVSLQDVNSDEDAGVANRMTELETKQRLLSERCEQLQDAVTNMQQQTQDRRAEISNSQIMELLENMQKNIPQTQAEHQRTLNHMEPDHLPGAPDPSLSLQGENSNQDAAVCGPQIMELLTDMQKDVLKIQAEHEALLLQTEPTHLPPTPELSFSLQDVNSDEDAGVANRMTELETKQRLLSERCEQLQDAVTNMQQQTQDRRAEISNSQIMELLENMQKNIPQTQAEHQRTLNHMEVELKSLSEQMDKLSTEMQQKLNRAELIPVHKQLMRCRRKFQEELQTLRAPAAQNAAAATRRQLAPLYSDTLHCLSCASIVKPTFGMKPSVLPCSPPFPIRESIGPLRAYARHRLQPQSTRSNNYLSFISAPWTRGGVGRPSAVSNQRVNNQKETQSNVTSNVSVQRPEQTDV